MPTCNRFDTKFVYRQWQEIERLFEGELEATLGPLIGDSRRCKIMLQLMRSREGLRFQPIPQNLGFVLSCRKEIKGESYVIRDLGDQDYIHNHKETVKSLGSQLKGFNDGEEYSTQGCALKKILGSPSGSQPCQLGCPAPEVGRPK